jgi:hypothetical protein
MKKILFTFTLTLFVSAISFAQVKNSNTAPVKAQTATTAVEEEVKEVKVEKKECSKKEKAGCCKKGASKATASSKKGCSGSAKAKSSKGCCKKGTAKAKKGCHGSKAMASNDDEKEQNVKPEEKTEKQ